MPVGQPKTGGSWGRDLTECGPLEKGMANHFSILALRTPWTVWKGKNDRILKEKLPRSVGAQYGTGDQWRKNSRKNEGMDPKQKQYPEVDVTGDRSKVGCCKEQYFIGTWNVRSMNQGKLIGYWKRNSLVQYVPNMLLEISGERTPGRMKGWSKSKNNTQLWMWLMMEVKSDAVRMILHRNLEY